MSETEVTVEAYSGYRYGERPRAFTWRGRRYQVLSVERRWRTPQGLGFVVTAALQTGDCDLAADNGLSSERWELVYDEVRDRWHARCANYRRR